MPLHINARYPFVLLDVDGTLLDYEKAETAALQTSFERKGICFTHETFTLFRQSSMEARRVLWENPGNRDAFRVGRFERLFSKLNLKEDAERFNNAFLSCLSETPFPLQGAGDTCRTLFQAGAAKPDKTFYEYA